jgi:hypothetical protein
LIILELKLSRQIKGKVVNADIHTVKQLMANKSVKNVTIKLVHVINALVRIILKMIARKMAPNAHQENAVIMSPIGIRRDALAQNIEETDL